MSKPISDKTENNTTQQSYLDKLKKQRAVIEARIQAAEARGKAAERKKDTRRKILVGSYYLDQVQKNNQWEDLKKKLDGFLTRESDRKLFDLVTAEKSPKNNKVEKETQKTEEKVTA